MSDDEAVELTDILPSDLPEKQMEVLTIEIRSLDFPDNKRFQVRKTA